MVGSGRHLFWIISLVAVLGLADSQGDELKATGCKYDNHGHMDLRCPPGRFIQITMSRVVVSSDECTARNTCCPLNNTKCAADVDRYHHVLSGQKEDCDRRPSCAIHVGTVDCIPWNGPRYPIDYQHIFYKCVEEMRAYSCLYGSTSPFITLSCIEGLHINITRSLIRSCYRSSDNRYCCADQPNCRASIPEDEPQGYLQTWRAICLQENSTCNVPAFGGLCRSTYGISYQYLYYMCVPKSSVSEWLSTTESVPNTTLESHGLMSSTVQYSSKTLPETTLVLDNENITKDDHVQPAAQRDSIRPEYVWPVVGVMSGLFVLTILIIIIVLFKKRGSFKGSQGSGAVENLSALPMGQDVQNSHPQNDYEMETPMNTSTLNTYDNVGMLANGDAPSHYTANESPELASSGNGNVRNDQDRDTATGGDVYSQVDKKKKPSKGPGTDDFLTLEDNQYYTSGLNVDSMPGVHGKAGSNKEEVPETSITDNDMYTSSYYSQVNKPRGVKEGLQTHYCLETRNDDYFNEDINVGSGEASDDDKKFFNIRDIAMQRCHTGDAIYQNAPIP